MSDKQKAPTIDSHTEKKRSNARITATLDDTPRDDVRIFVGKPINNWNDANKKTLKAWKQSLLKASFIYQYVLDVTKSRLNMLLVFILILTSVSSLLSAISTILLTVDSSGYKLAALILSIIIAIIGAVTAILTGSIKIYGLDNVVIACTSYIERIDQLYSIIANQLVLPDNLKEDAVTFIKKMSADYLGLIQTNPDINGDQETEGLKLYNKFMEDKAYSFNLSQKHDNDFAIEVIG